MNHNVNICVINELGNIEASVGSTVYSLLPSYLL